jgi:glyoxylase-like metal-dependent hydrolase (beta-lactamase superfamily II)
MSADPARDQVAAQITAALADPALRPQVAAFFDEPTNTVSYVVHDPATRAAAILDSVLDFDPASGRTATRAAQRLVDHVRAQALQVHWLLETHVHADHLSAAPWLQRELGGQIAIGRGIVGVQAVFAEAFNAEPGFARDGSQFDRLFADGEGFALGQLAARVLHVPGHTPACVAYAIGDALFVGDTLFMPDYGTARCDFPGGDARALYRSIHRLLGLPDATRVFLCHDYKAPGRDEFRWETTIATQRAHNIHVHPGVDEAAFVAMRQARDATLAMPRLLLPSVQVNMRGGRLPPPEDNGVAYLKLPLDRF